MDIKGAKKKVNEQYPDKEILKSYSGKLDEDNVFGFIVGDGYDNCFVVVYEDGELREVNGPMAGAVARSLTEVM